MDVWGSISMDAFVDNLRDLVRQIVREERAADEKRQEYMTTDQAAAFACVSVPSIRRWILQGKLVRYGAGREVRISRAELEARMQNGDSGRPRPNPPKKTPRVVPDDIADEVFRSKYPRR